MKMESKQSSRPTALFPAYTNSDEGKGTKDEKDWLYNSSFSKTAFEEASFQVTKLQSSSEPLSPSEPLPIIIPKKKKKLKSKTAHKRYADIIDTFSVPESESILSQLQKKTFIEETGLSYERAFQIDKTRDPENLMYEHFERTKIARYFSIRKVPFGLSKKEVSKWPTVPETKKKSIRYFSKKFLKSLHSCKEINVIKSSLYSTSSDYISLKSDSNCVASLMNSSSNFIGISRSWKSEESKNASSSYTDISPIVSDASSQYKDKIAFYNKKLTESPNNIELWSEFVNFQDEILMAENSKENDTSEKVLIEKKIAILDKAITHNPKDVSLHIARLRLSLNVCNINEVLSKWEDLVFLNPTNAAVWQEYLLCALSNLTMFSTSSIIKLYSKCLQTLSKLNEGIIVSHESPSDIVPNMISIFIHLCHILKSCGYNEKAIAACQALLEFNLFSESAMKLVSSEEQIMFFEPFWDSGAQRIGEEGAIGWTATVEQKKIVSDHLVTDSDLNPSEDEILSKKLPLCETWLEFEELREHHHWLPWKPNPLYDQTNDDVDDPDRTVSFEDISKFLFRIQEEEHKFLLILNVLTFFDFDFHAVGCHDVLYKTRVYNPINIENFENISKYVCNVLSLKQSSNPFTFSEKLWTKEKYNFVNNFLLLAPLNFSVKYKNILTRLWLKFLIYSINEGICLNDLSYVKKVTKSTLKKNENRNNLLLWFEYITIEWMCVKSSAKKTFMNLLLSSSVAVSENSMQVNEVWYLVHSFIDLHFNNEVKKNEMNCNELLWVLLHVGSKVKFEPFSNQELKPVMILKAAADFKRALEQEISSLSSKNNILCQCVDPNFYSIISCMKCYAYLQYFSQGIESALKVYEYTISSVTVQLDGYLKNYIVEQLSVAQADLLHFHTWNSYFSIKPLQTFLFDTVTKFPHNCKLLYFLIKLRSASAVLNPSRRFFMKILRKSVSSPLTWAFTIFSEYLICHSLSFQDVENHTDPSADNISSLGIHWRIRSLYEKMLNSDLCSHIPVLWRSYLKFEILTKNLDRAKSVFYRAAQNCGWSKALLMDGIKYFPEDLKQILDLMAEKQLRIHSPLEEVSLLMENVMN